MQVGPLARAPDGTAEVSAPGHRSRDHHLESVVPEELIRDFNQSVASLQLAYAGAAGEGADGEG